MPRGTTQPKAQTSMLSRSISFSSLMSSRSRKVRSRKFAVNGLESLPQVKHRIVLARKQRVHARAGLRRKLFEALAHHLVSDEYFALLVGQFFQSGFQLFQQG